MEVKKTRAHIPGGYVLESRQVLTSELWWMPPDHYKLFRFLIMAATHSQSREGGHRLRRGQLWTDYEQLRGVLTYYAGLSPRRPSKPRIAKMLRRLRECNVIATAKATRGLVITVLNYDRYQTAANYESNGERTHERNGPETDRFHDRQEGKEVNKETTPPPPLAPERLRADLGEYAASETVEVVVLFFEENGLNERTARILLGQLRHAEEKNGTEPVRRALVELATSLSNGQQPTDPARLPNYFTPILKRAVLAWRREERERREAEERERERVAYQARLEQVRAERQASGTRLFEKFRRPRSDAQLSPADEAARREALLKQAQDLVAQEGAQPGGLNASPPEDCGGSGAPAPVAAGESEGKT